MDTAYANFFVLKELLGERRRFRIMEVPLDPPVPGHSNLITGLLQPFCQGGRHARR